ncbi:RNA polymerase sigma-70 factor (ECF subfamily) [Alteromonadaceae bacterium 2753L.S.0a.02]|nr:RNA polymerase sigma-70 factor (ECF subfamily) [Alteromonadaceae bacterium 2753L.S.0a.02]
MNMKQPLGNLFERYQSELIRQLMYKFKKTPDDAADIVQDAFHNILRLNNIETLENPKAYLYQTASNLALNRIRNQKRQAELLSEMVYPEENEITPERTTSAQSDLEKLESVMHELPEKYRKTFLLSRVQGLSYREISDQLGIAESTVEKHVIRVLKHLRKHLVEGEAL